MKLSTSPHEFLRNLSNGQFDGPTPIFWLVWEMGWIATACGPSDFYVTPAGREALEANDA